MKKTIIILTCILLLAAGVPLFARGHGSDHGRFQKDNPQRWNGSPTHPALNGWHGWGNAPCRAPDGIPTENPSEGPQDHPGNTPVEQPGEKPTGDQPVKGMLQILDLAKGSVIG